MACALDQVHPRYGLLWDLGIETGLRISDLLQLRVCDFEYKLLHVVEKKTQKERSIDISSPLRSLLRAFFDAFDMLPCDFVFWRRRNQRNIPISRQWASHVISQAAKYLGLPGVTAHSMRKTYACRVYMHTGSLEATRRALNHKYVSTTAMYLTALLEASTGH